MALTALVNVEGLVGAVTASAMPRYTPGGFADGGRQLLQWQMELHSSEFTAPIAAEAGVLFRAWDPAIGLDPDKVYTIRARVQDSGWAWSPWVTQVFRTSFRNPRPASVTVTETVYGGVPAYAVVAVFPTDFVGNQRTVVIQRTDPVHGWVNEAERILPLAGQNMANPAGPNPADVFHVEHLCYIGASDGTTQFRVKGTVQADSVVISGGWAYSVPIAFTETRLGGWLIDPRHPHRCVKTTLVSRTERKIATGAMATAMMAPMPSRVAGGSHMSLRAVSKVSKQATQGLGGSMTLRTRTHEEHAATRDLLLGGGQLFMRGHLHKSPDGGRRRGPDLWLRVVGDLTEDDVVAHASERALLTFEYTEQRPYGLEDLREYRVT